MKVSELIEWLSKFSPDDVVGGFDCGMDTGDWVEYVFPEKNSTACNLIIRKAEVSK